MGSEWSVEYVEVGDKKPFEDFVLSLPKKERARVFEAINYFLQLRNENLPIKESLSKHIEDEIFELRVTLRDRIARNLYFYQKGSKIVITHGFIKKTRKTPRKEIETAKKLRKQYLRSKHD